MTDEQTVSERGLPHDRCFYSTGIDGGITAGQGRLDESGYFAIPCPECAEKWRQPGVHIIKS